MRYHEDPGLFAVLAAVLCNRERIVGGYKSPERLNLGWQAAEALRPSHRSKAPDRLFFSPQRYAGRILFDLRASFDMDFSCSYLE